MRWGNFQNPALWQDSPGFERPPSLVPWFSRFSARTHNQDSEFEGLGRALESTLQSSQGFQLRGSETALCGALTHRGLHGREAQQS